MAQQIWINLPVKDVARAKAFFSRLGFNFNETHDTPVSACMLVGAQNTVVMLFKDEVFKTFTQHPVTDTTQSSEVLFSIDAASRQEVDDLAAKVKEAGGLLYGPPAENQGWMYGCGFADPDGHRWNVLYMDLEKMPKPE